MPACASSACTSRRPPHGFLAKATEYADAATIPRLLVLRRLPLSGPSAWSSGPLGRGPVQFGGWLTSSYSRVCPAPAGPRRPKHIEDLGWFVIDNLPPALIPEVAELARRPGSTIDRVALAVGSGRHAEVAAGIDWLRSSGVDRVRTLFLSAPHAGARATLRGDPSSAPVQGVRQPERCDRVRAGRARGHPGRRRCRDRHLGSPRAPAPGPDHRAVR